MKAAVYRRYGPPEVVQIEDVEKPVPLHGEVVIKVHAASVNPYDWHFMRGSRMWCASLAGWVSRSPRSWAPMFPARWKRRVRT